MRKLPSEKTVKLSTYQKNKVYFEKQIEGHDNNDKKLCSCTKYSLFNR
ncbi:hypothetical protein bcgnr5390_61470 [Bacillus luti]